jgi:putative transposase
VLILSDCFHGQNSRFFSDFHGTVWSFYRRARISGLWEVIMDELVQATRTKAGRAASPSYTLIDSQSAKTVGASEERGIDGGKKGKRTQGVI